VVPSICFISSFSVPSSHVRGTYYSIRTSLFFLWSCVMGRTDDGNRSNFRNIKLKETQDDGQCPNNSMSCCSVMTREMFRRGVMRNSKLNDSGRSANRCVTVTGNYSSVIHHPRSMVLSLQTTSSQLTHLCPRIVKLKFHPELPNTMVEIGIPKLPINRFHLFTPGVNSNTKQIGVAFPGFPLYLGSR
jgi:hypothetical protein